MRQASLFDLSPMENIVGLAGLMPAIRAAMNRVAGEDQEGRKMLVTRINDVARREGISLTTGGGKAITYDILNKWLQPGDKGHEPSFMSILCFCLATQDASPLQPVFKALGLEVIHKNERWFLDIGRACEAEREAKEKIKALRARKHI